MISRLRALWNNVFRRNQLEHDLDEELHAYLALVAAEKARSGISPEQAWRDARREMGGVDQVRQNVRDIRAGVLLDRLAQDLRYGIRTLAKSPAFSLVAVATLALGIGANTAMFSLLDQIVLSLLPVRHPEQLVIVRETGNHYGNSYGINTVSWPMFEDLRDHNQVFSGNVLQVPHQRNRRLRRSRRPNPGGVGLCLLFPHPWRRRRPGPHHRSRRRRGSRQPAGRGSQLQLLAELL